MCYHQNNKHRVILIASFQNSLVKPIPDCLTFLDFATAEMTEMMLTAGMCKTVVESSPAIYQHSIFYTLDALPVA